MIRELNKANRAQYREIVMQANRWKGYYHTVSFRVTELDEERLKEVFRKYKVPFGISRSSKFRALIGILAAEEKDNK